MPADDGARVAGDCDQLAVRRLVEIAKRRAVLPARGVVAHGLDELVAPAARRDGRRRPYLPICVSAKTLAEVSDDMERARG